MSIWKRISTLLKSNINSIISSAEDPEKNINKLIVDMREQFVEARKQVAIAIADEKRLKRQYQQEAKKAAEWEKKAMMAIKAGRDDLARQALARKGEHEGISAGFQEQWMAQKKASDQLREALQMLNTKIQEAGRKKNLIIARQKRAEAQKKIYDTMSGVKNNSAFDTFARMEEKVDRMEAEGEAAMELSGDMGDNLSMEFSDLESSPVAQDDALASLKAKMGVAPAPGTALPSAVSTDAVETAEADSVEAELEALLSEGN
jgi:phage shock protein A